MALRSVLEIVLHVENFRNIDLYYQGLYYLKFQIYLKNGEQKVYAHPYCMTEAYKAVLDSSQGANKMVKIGETQCFKPASINDSNSSFFSKSFFIKFCEEEVELNDFCHYRIELEVMPEYEKQLLYIDVDLMFYDCLNNANSLLNNPENKTPAAERGEAKSLASAHYKVKDFLKGLHEFMPIVFEEQHFSVANTMIHTQLLDYRYRISPLQLSHFAKIKLDEKTLLTETQLLPEETNNKLYQNNSLYEYLCKFYKNVDYDFVQEKFVNPMKKSYEDLLDHYNYISSKCITDKQKKSFKKYLQPPMKLIIPEYVNKENKDSKKDFVSKFNENLKSKDPEIICESILSEVNFISGQVFQLWHKFLDILKITPRFVSAVLHHEYARRIKEKWGASIIRNVIKTNDFTANFEDNIGDTHKVMANQKRNEVYYKKSEPMNVEDVNMFPKPEVHPIIFEQVYTKDTKDSKDRNEENILDPDLTVSEAEANNYKGIHLFVLVHGFQGNSFDMKLLKNHLNLLHPEAMFLCSCINEDNTEGDIGDMGERLANEVITFIGENCPGSSMGRISFIGHSLGGLIIRASLKHLDEYAEKMYTYISLSTPHLGYMYTSSKIIEAGMWILKRWRKSHCLTQLSMSDSKNIEETFLYQLSQSKGLKWFKNVALISSFQDQYAPFDSARIEVCREATSDSAKGRFYIQMARGILSNLSTSTLHRIDVNFNIPEKNLDTIIGRAAHILFLESQPLIRMLVYRYENFFA